jgi:hypothetical protein
MSFESKVSAAFYSEEFAIEANAIVYEEFWSSAR